ncbi:MAG: tRNA lysidine(34) synthetase TilS [Candidatus Omnitrophota bacterium]|nr:tRNA lysidine(34) synthetase TilS [Candidatus Omnitrophota bacterium]
MIRLKVRKTIEDNSLIKKGDKVLVAVSGGPDSIALLHILAELSGRYNIGLVVAHLNHMLRGKEADADADFVRKTADNLSLPFMMEKVSVKNIAKARRMSIEEAARETRYDFYNRAAAKYGASKIATGHTLDDQAETVLMRLLKGSGSLGLSGIPYKRKSGNIWVIRPILDVTRKEIDVYLKKNRISSRIDASNSEIVYFRNKIRNILIPVLEKDFNPRIKCVLASMASTLTDESSYLAGVASKKMKHICRTTVGGVELNIKGLRCEHAALQRLIVRQALAYLAGGLKGITYKHWEVIESLMKGETHKQANLPGRIKAVKNNGKIIFTRKSADHKGIFDLKKAATLNVPGEIIIPGLGTKIKAEVIKRRPDFKKKKSRNTEYVNGDLIGSHLEIRMKRAGDRMKPLGMASYKKLHDIFVDEKISREHRNMVPIVISGNKILWAAGVRLSDEFKINEGTKRILKLSTTST